MTTVIGVDPSLTGTCLFDGTDFLKIAPKTSGRVRMVEIRDTVLDYVADRPDPRVFMENFAFSRAQHAHDKGGLGWVLRIALLEAGHRGWLVWPNGRAKFATGKGNAGKDAVVSAVSARTGIVFESNDHVDAFVLHCLGLAYLGEPHPLGDLPKTHLAAIEDGIKTNKILEF